MRAKEEEELDFQRKWREFDWSLLMEGLRTYWQKYRYLDQIDSVIKPLSNKAILDVGCGVISVLNIFKEPAAVFYGIDPLMHEYQKLYKLDQNIQWSSANGEGIPFDDDRFDVVFCTNILDHVEDPLRVADELGRVLKPLGHLVLTIDIFEKEEVRDAAHPHAFTSGKVDELIVRTSSEVVFDQYSPIRAQIYWYMKNSLHKDRIRERIIIARKKGH